ncbi:hypothetical protein ACOME3_005788 [Neoechinorhynchus agilis]
MLIFLQAEDSIKALQIPSCSQSFVEFLELAGVDVRMGLKSLQDGFSCGSSQCSDVSVGQMIKDHGNRYSLLGAAVLGGKVHGSLARAGKVKGQTPKVEKTEKKKKLTGRAKRRQQYVKRFKRSVADTKGRKRR